jgi:uroporphyrinogen-III synthase
MANQIDLTGFTVGITADRRGEDQAVMFRRLGAEVMLGATINTISVPDSEELRVTTDLVISDPPDYLIANTGLGVRTWMAQAAEWDLAERLKGALSGSRIAARGPKAAGAVGLAGLQVWWRAPGEQLGDVVDHLVAEGLQGKRVAFQLHGDSGEGFTRRLTEAGAEVIPIPVYRWTTPLGSQAATKLIEMCCEDRVDAVTFTAGPQIRNMVAIAEGIGLSAPLLVSLNGRTVVGCIGPVCASVAVEEGISEPLVPPNWRLGSLVRTVSEALVASRP